jgi:hypothetical protein
MPTPENEGGKEGVGKSSPTTALEEVSRHARILVAEPAVNFRTPRPMDVDVDPSGVAERSGALCELAERLLVMRGTWSDRAGNPGEACGHAEVSIAYREMFAAWFGEVGAHAEVLRQACAGLRDSARTYQIANREIADGMSRSMRANSGTRLE